MSKTPTAWLDEGKKKAAPQESGGPGRPPGGAVGLKSGTRLGKYEVIGRLGVGGMAIVYKGYDPLLDRFVAIKQIGAHLAGDPKFIERFRKEAQLLARLGADQVSVVQIYELIEDARGLFIVTEYVEGQTLDVLIDRQTGPMPEQLALEVLWHVAVGLKAIHERGIIHRDIKPANVLVAVNHRCKITDFGVAARSGGRTSMTLGTTKYMAPELFSGEEVDGRVDIYSLGCIMFEMLAGQAKFREIFKDVVRDDRAESLRWMKWHTNREMAAPMLNVVNPKVPEVLAKIVAKMMAKAPEQRFRSADHLLEILKRHFTQTGQARHRAVAAAKQRAAGQVREAPRVPEPIPDRADESAGAAVAAAPVAVGAPRPAGAPKTTKLPKRKMTRRQRLTVLSALLVVVMAVMIAWMVLESGKKSRLRNAAIAEYEKARALWVEGKYKEARDRLVLLQTTSDDVLAARQRVAQLEQTLRTTSDVAPERPARVQELEQAKARLAQLEKYARLYQKDIAEEGIPARIEMIDARLAVAARNWEEAERLEKAMRDRASRAGVQGLRPQELRDFSAELRIEKGFVAKLDEATRTMADGLERMDPRLFQDAKKLLDEAGQIKKSENLEPYYDELAAASALYEYRDLMAKGDRALARNNVGEARKMYQKAADLRATREVRDKVADLDRRDKYAKAIADAEGAIAANNAEKAATCYEAALGVYPTITAEIKAVLDPIFPVDDLPKRVNKLRAWDAYRKAKAAFDRDPTDRVTILQWISVCKRHDPSLPQVIELENRIKTAATYQEVMATANRMKNTGDYVGAIAQFRDALKLLTEAADQPKRDAIYVEIRECSYRNAYGEAEKAMREGRLGPAQQAYNRAKGFAGNNQGRLNAIDVKLAQIATTLSFRKAIDDADKLFSANKLTESLKGYKEALAIGRKAADEQGGGRQGHYTADLVREANERIKDVRYTQAVQDARSCIDRKLWKMADTWLNQAASYKDTDEVKRLKAEVAPHLDEELPTLPAAAPAGGPVGVIE